VATTFVANSHQDYDFTHTASTANPVGTSTFTFNQPLSVTQDGNPVDLYDTPLEAFLDPISFFNEAQILVDYSDADTFQHAIGNTDGSTEINSLLHFRNRYNPQFSEMQAAIDLLVQEYEFDLFELLEDPSLLDNILNAAADYFEENFPQLSSWIKQQALFLSLSGQYIYDDFTSGAMFDALAGYVDGFFNAISRFDSLWSVPDI